MKKSWKLIPIVALAIGLVIPVSAPAAEDTEAFFAASITRENPSDKIFSISDDVGINFRNLVTGLTNYVVLPRIPSVISTPSITVKKTEYLQPQC